MIISDHNITLDGRIYLSVFIYSFVIFIAIEYNLNVTQQAEAVESADFITAKR